MKLCVSLILFLILCPLAARAQADGLYVLYNKPTDVSVTALDGKLVYLGPAFREKIDRVDIVSDSNDNHSFRVHLFQNKPIGNGSEKGPLALVLGKKCLCLDSWGGEDTGTSYTTAWGVDDSDFIKAVAACYRTTPQLRHHPGHQFTARFATDPAGYAAGKPVLVTLQITNCGKIPFSMHSNPDANMNLLWTPFTFAAIRSNAQNNKVETLPPLASFGGLGILLTLRPGDTQSFSVDVTKFLKLDTAGHYLVRGTFAFNVMQPPPGYKVLWDEFATAEFEVKIR